MRRGPKSKFGKVIMILVCAAAFVSLFSFIVMSLWNAILPDVLHVTTITFWQAMGILVLSKILFGFGGGHWGGKKHEFKRRMQERWGNMSEEERAALKAKLKNRFNHWCQPDQEEPKTTKPQAETE